MRYAGFYVFLACVVVFALAGYALARGDGTHPQRIPAVVRCAHPAEDSLAHVRMVRYDPDAGVLVYACKRTGY
jgi:hypothetical protein